MISKKNQSEIINKIFYVKIKVGDLKFDKKEFHLALGYKVNKIPKHFSRMIDVILSELPKKCRIKTGFRIMEMHRLNDKLSGVRIGNIFFKTDKIITGQIKKSEMIAVFVCSLGSGMEKWSKQLITKGEILLSYLVDSLASVVVEKVADYLHDSIELQMNKRGLKITNRYSPGFCNWSVEEQYKLFSLLPPKFCGVRLNASALMIPIKSISGIIGIGNNVSRKNYICDKCGMKDCTYKMRRILHPG